MDNYAADQMREQIKRGPQPDEDFYRMKIYGSGETKTFNVTQEQVETFAAILDGSAKVVLA